MTLLQNSFEGGADGATLTSANTGGASGSTLTVTGTAGVFDSVTVAHGGLSARFNAAAAANGFVSWASLSGTTLTVRAYVYLSTVPSATCQILTMRNTGSTTVAAIQVATTGKLQVANAVPTSVFTAAAAVTLNTWYRVELSVTAGTSTTDGKMSFAYYLGDSTTAVETFTTTTTNTGTTALTTAFFGKITSAPAMDMRIDDVAATDTTATFIGPYVFTNQTPIANAGSRQANILPGATVTLTGVDSDADGTVTGRAWRQISGTAVTLNGTGATRTYTAPTVATGDQLVFGYTATDNLGLASSESTVSHHILPAAPTTTTAYTFGAEAGADAGPINSGDNPGLTVASVSGTTLAYTTTQAQRGLKSARVVAGANDTAYLQFSPLGSSYQVSAPFYVYVTAYPAAGTHLAQVRNSTTGVAQVVLAANGTLLAQGAGGTNVGTASPTPVPLNTWVRVEFGVIAGTTSSNGTVRAAWAVGDAAPTWTVDSGPTANTGTSPLSITRFGKPNTSGDLDGYVDTIRVDNRTAAFLGAPVGSAPTANAGPDQVVEPFSAVTLTGSGSDTDGAIATYAWTQLSGPQATLSGTGATRTFTAPGGQAQATYTFGLVVTDTGGLSSPQDTVTVTVSPATEFYAKSGSWKALQVMGSW